MAEVQSKVYDILFPSPPALKEIVSISIAVQLWRQEINSHRIKNILDKLDLGKNILPSSSMSSVQFAELSMIEKYIKQVGLAIQQWLGHHFNRDLFNKEIFNDFIDFVGDFDGSIHYVRTARRIVQCAKLDEILRFKIACTYCFEDDILQIWPSVSTRVDLMNTVFNMNPELYYWICRLYNQLYKLPRSNVAGQSAEENVFRTSFSPWSFMEYFWNLLDSDSRMRIAADPPLSFPKMFCRFLLPKFNEAELDKFVNTKWYTVICSLLPCDDEEIEYTIEPHRFVNDDGQNRGLHVKAAWTHIKDKISGDGGFYLVREIIRKMCYSARPIDTSAYCEIWKIAPDHLKRHALGAILLEKDLFQRKRYLERLTYQDGSFSFDFVFIILSDASAEERSLFWNKHWRNLIRIFRTTYLDQLMSLCFSNQSEIINFKLNSFAGDQNLRRKCGALFKEQSLEELIKFLNFCWLDEQSRRSIQQDLLRQNLKISYSTTGGLSPLLSDFVNDSFDDVSLAVDFKTQVLFSRQTIAKINDFATNLNQFHYVLQFIDLLASSEQVACDFKKIHVYPVLERNIRRGSFWGIEIHDFSIFLRDCYGSDDDIARFKKTLSVNSIVRRVIRETIPALGSKFNSFLVHFLEWYFITPQALEKFKSKYVDDEDFVLLITKSD
ncbi:uncharacterized protein LOC135840818 isoform X8 [Planococcus citri]|uniref:uncharacterized protein LOC135840818 isoform X8 n=1 Tax=Planococcus citri TaxID=170843 RepID=UPI0031FA48BA